MSFDYKQRPSREYAENWEATFRPRREKCRNADSYKAVRAPKCGCLACATKWAEAQKAKENQ